MTFSANARAAHKAKVSAHKAAHKGTTHHKAAHHKAVHHHKGKRRRKA